MLISTKGRYATRMLLDIAMHQGNGYVPMKDVALRQQISKKYMETFTAHLSSAGILGIKRGKDGGYRLTRAPEGYTIGSILKLTEGSLAPISCSAFGSAAPDSCEQAGSCITYPMWRHLDEIIDGYLEHVTLADLLAGNV